MNYLTEKKCQACEAGVPPLSSEKTATLLKEIPSWSMQSDSLAIIRRFEFKNFYKTMAFVNAVAWVANQENHHPDLEVSYNACVVKYSTHAINGLSENDFICAAKIDRLMEEL